MKKDRSNDFEYWLGFDPLWEEYEIIEHNVNRPKGDGTFCFQVGNDSISDGDGFPASYDDSYVKIDENDFQYVIDLFHKAGEEICALAEKHGRPIERPIVAGDYVYDGGSFIHIQNLSYDREKLWIEEFYYDGYDLDVYIDLDVVGKTDEYDLNEIESEGLFITEALYLQAINIAKSAILEITDHLRRLHTQKLSEKSYDQ
ncbi:MAG: hypothetical protein K2M54_01465 [Muribaculaceae bacterium]|nr:hypothetical protein [Muribaculaceae bacterium]